MARPLTLYKGKEKVNNVYPSELATWQAQGWTLEPVSEPEQPKQQPLVVVGDRQAELESMSWRQLRSVATKLGLEKSDDQNWDDLIPDIIKAENR
jgi:hypothetical protein